MQTQGLTEDEFYYVFLDSSVDSVILEDELKTFKKTISQYHKDTPYYVYALCNLDGTPFYIGKGKHMRAYQHIKNAKNDYKSNKRNINHIKDFLAQNSHPIIYIMDGDLSSHDASQIESKYIQHYGRIGFEANGILTNIMPNHIQFGNNELMLVNSYAGKLGGKITKDNKLGIFSDSYDRSAETKRRWDSGELNDDVFGNYDRAIGGNASVKSKKGIHASDYNHSEMSKKNWNDMSIDRKLALKELSKINAKLGGEKSKELQTNFTTWDKDKHIEACRAGGKVSGSTPMWTNGILNKRAKIQPEFDYFRGITKKHKMTKELVIYKYNIKDEE